MTRRSAFLDKIIIALAYDAPIHFILLVPRSYASPICLREYSGNVQNTGMNEKPHQINYYRGLDVWREGMIIEKMQLSN